MVKKLKHPDAPKAALGSYMMFCKEERPNINKDFPDHSAKMVLTELGIRWKKLTEDDKSKYKKLADEDKVRFEKEREVFLRTHDSMYLDDGSKRKVKGKKDPNAPKGAKSAYIFFSADVREKVKTELAATMDPVMPTDIMRRVGELWREMDEETKAPYQTKADEDKARYQREKSEYDEDNA